LEKKGIDGAGKLTKRIRAELKFLTGVSWITNIVSVLCNIGTCWLCSTLCCYRETNSVEWATNRGWESERFGMNYELWRIWQYF
jgi:hypothetical protein